MFFSSWMKVKMKNRKIFLLAGMAGFIFSFAASAQEITAVDFNGDLLGKVIPDGKVVSFDNELIGNVNADSLIVNGQGALIGGVIPQGIVIGNDNKMLGKVNNDGSVRMSSGKIAGKALPNGLVVDDDYEIIGAILFPGLVYSDFGKTIGRLTGDGNYTNLDGQTIGFVSADGFAYRKTGDTYVVDGKLISSKMVISQEGRFIGSVALGGKITDFDSNIIGNIHANGYAYDDEGRIIGHIVRNGYAISNNGEYLGFVSYNGDVVKENNIVGHLRFDEKVVDDAQNVIGFFVDIAAAATDLSGKYLGRVMPDGKIVKAKEVIGSVGPHGNVLNAAGDIVGKLVNPGPVFDFKATLLAHALKNGEVISLEGSSAGKIVGSNVLNNAGRIVGATFKDMLVIDKNNKPMGMNGVSGTLGGAEHSYVSPFGYVYAADGAIFANAIPLNAVYDLYGAIFGFVSPNAEVLNRDYAKVSDITQFGYARSDDKQIKGKNIIADFIINRAGELLGMISENNLIIDAEKKVIAKIMPDMSVAASGAQVDRSAAPKIATAYAQKMAMARDGSVLGYVNEQAEVKDTEGSSIGKVTDNGFIVNSTGKILGSIMELGTVVDDKCDFIGVVTPRGDVRNYKNSLIGKVFLNGQVVSDGGAVVGHVVKKNLLIDREGNIFATPSVNGFAFGNDNNKVGCVGLKGYLKDENGAVIAKTLDYAPVMDFSGKIVGRSVFDGTVINEDGALLGMLQPNDSVVNSGGKTIGRLFKYKYAFDNNNSLLGRVLESGRVINNKNEDVGAVDYQGYVVDKGERIGYASYDLYVYDEKGSVVGYIENDGSVRGISGSNLGKLNKGFLLNKNNKLVGRINRDYWIRGKDNSTVGELSISGKLYSLDNEFIGTLAKDGKIKNADGEIIGTPYQLQYYSEGQKPKESVVDAITEWKAEPMEEPSESDVSEMSSKIIGIALTPDGEYLGNIMSNGDVLSKDGVLLGKKNADGTIVDMDGNLIGIEDIKRPGGQDIFVPAGTFGPGGAYGIGQGVGDLGPGGGYGQGERYNASRVAALQQAQEERRQSINVGKITTQIKKNSVTGYEEYGWPDEGKNVSTYRVDMSNMILADKPIPAVLARSVDGNHTDTPLTAYVERNIYAEDGRNIIIPAGSRVIGKVNSIPSDNQNPLSNAVKVDISWERLIRPDGIAFKFNSATTGDAQGRGGALAYVDNQLLKRYGSPFLLTAVETLINFHTAVSSHNTGDTENSKQQAANDAREQFNKNMDEMFKQAVQESINMEKLVYIPAGTRVIIYPQEDLWLRTAESDKEDETANLKDPDIFMNDKEQTEKRESRGKSDEDPSGGGSSATVLYENGVDNNIEAQSSDKLLIDDAQASAKRRGLDKKKAAAPAATGALPPPPPSYDGSSSKGSSSSSNVPTLF